MTDPTDRNPEEYRKAREWLTKYKQPIEHRTGWMSTTDELFRISTTELAEMFVAYSAQRDQEHARREAEEAFGELGDLVTCREGKKHPIVRTNGVRDRCLYCERDEATSALSALRQAAKEALDQFDMLGVIGSAGERLRRTLGKLEKPVSGS